MFNSYFKDKNEDLRGSPTGIAQLVRVQTAARWSKRFSNRDGTKPLAHEAPTVAREVPRLDKGGQ